MSAESIRGDMIDPQHKRPLSVQYSPPYQEFPNAIQASQVKPNPPESAMVVPTIERQIHIHDFAPAN